MAAVLVLGVLLLALAYRKGIPLGLDAAGWQIASFWILFLGELVVLEAVLPSFGGAGWFADWWVHFHRSLVYANLVPVADVARACADPRLHCVAPVYDRGVMTARTPLFNLLAGMPLSLDHGRIAAYQISAMVWTSVVAGPIVLLAQRRGLRAGWLAGALLLANPHLVHMAIYPWSTVLTVAFEVLAVYWLLRLRDGARWAGAAVVFSLGIAVFTHDSALIYVFAIAVYLAIWRRPSWGEWRSMLTGLLLVFLVTLPWIAWGIHTYGWTTVLHSSPATYAGYPGAQVWVREKIDGMIYSFVPMPLAHSLAVAPFANQQALWSTVNSALELWFDSYPGALGVVAALLLLCWYPRARLGKDSARLGWCVAICAALGSVLLDPAILQGGAAQNALDGAVAIGIALLAAAIPARAQFAVLLAVGLEAALVFALYLGYLSLGPWKSNPNTFVLAGMKQRLLSETLGRPGIALLVVAVLGMAAIVLCLGAASRRAWRPNHYPQIMLSAPS
jgi:hypothetical protein